MEFVHYLLIAPVPSEALQVATSFSVNVNTITKQAEYFIINIAIDAIKAQSKQLDIPVFLPVSYYQSYQHYQLLNHFQRGEPFCGVILDGLRIYRTLEGEHFQYHGTADSFEVVENPQDYFDKEALL